MLLLLGGALAVPVFGITIFWQSELDREVDAQLLSEADKLRTFARTARDPYTGEHFASAASLLTAFMAVHRPEHDAAFFSVVGGRVDRRSPGPLPARLDRDPAVVALMAAVADTRIRWLDSPAGKVRYGVVPVQVAGDPVDTRLVLLAFRDQQLRQERQMAQMLLASGAFALVVAGLASWLVAGRVLAPIRLGRQTAERISETDLAQRLTVRGSDDVAALAETFNHMLDRLSHAFSAQRRFLDEVAHELRTPITVVRGHLELMDRELMDREAAKERAGKERPDKERPDRNPTDPDPDIQHHHQTRALLLDELDRMSRIVEDLLLLARAGRPGFLTLGPTSLTDLVVDAAAKAQALGPRHWKVSEVADATVHLDGQRVTQVLMQLAANAVSHTMAGDTIEIGSRLRRGRAVLWVADTGPGVAPGDRERIFHCFYQAGTSYPGRTATGIGIGLALIREIAQAHHGTAHVEDAPGGGARFVIDLPAHAPAPALAPHLTTEGSHGEQDSDSRGRGANSRLRREGTAP
ncbi:HAMP domain-containing histidine kinase [Streptomyces sp. NBC_00237]|uniref:sensor histidine kinase n=1 Tax=Streptomyces sp. NBC_00237 TaxID=2975687 RepID=UPI00225403A7|nr:HAMP domain-containing sensor histidine kinase [Streptomyces sp. NBC_00237]MCX5204869.1 HAMP domain-containing histidine kinase [Streptomyces sp. NBC_00237]